MSKKGFVPIIIVLIVALLAVGGITGYTLIKNKQPNKETTTTTIEATVCLKEQDCCFKNSDCGYAWFAGCHTPEYIIKAEEEAAKRGEHIGEATPYKVKVNCFCENHKCVARDIFGRLMD